MNKAILGLVCVLVMVGVVSFFWSGENTTAPELMFAPVAAKPAPPQLSPVQDEVVRASLNEDVAPPEDLDESPLDGSTIAGRVLTHEGKPAPGATVAAYTAETAAIRATAGADGRFQISKLPAGLYRVSASLIHYNEAVLTDIAPGRHDVTLTMLLLSGVEGRVVRDDTGAPMAQFEILYLKTPPTDKEYWQEIVYSDTSPWTPVSNPDGRYRLNEVQSDKSFAVAARAPGFEPAFIQVSASKSGATAEAPDIRLCQEARIQGRILSPENEPVGGAALYLGSHTHGRPVGESKASGEYQLAQLPEGEITLTADHPDHLPNSVTTTLQRGEVTHLDIVLSGGGWVEGTVYEGDMPLSGQPVLARRFEGTNVNKQVMTDEDGFYSIRGLPDGPVEIMVDRYLNEPGVPPIRLQKQALIEQGQVTEVDFQIQDASAAIHGKVTFGGKPVENARIIGRVTGGGSDSFFGTYSNKDGQWSADNLPAGEAWVQITATVSKDREQTKNLPMTLAANQDHELNAEFGGTSSITGTVRGHNKGEVVEIKVLMGRVDVDMTTVEKALELQNITVVTCNPKEDGSFEIPSLPEGIYTLLATAFDPERTSDILESIRANSAEVTLTAGQSQRVSITIP